MNDREKGTIGVAGEWTVTFADKGPVDVDPDLADDMGAFEETAISEEDAIDDVVLDRDDPADDVIGEHETGKEVGHG